MLGSHYTVPAAAGPVPYPPVIGYNSGLELVQVIEDDMDEQISKLLQAAEPLIELALNEDIGPGDATSLATLGRNTRLSAHLVAKAAGVIAGLPIAEAVFCRVDPAISFRAHVSDGQEVVPGELVAEVSGPAPALLAAERTALNFLQRMSGIATVTRSYVDAAAIGNSRILDTRKTIPGYRVLDKYAVRMGGGVNHRMSLNDMLMVKDNHIDGAGSLEQAVESARAAFPHLPIEVEVRNLDELGRALAVEPPLDRILLDNMSTATMRDAVRLTDGRVPLEASGNVTLARVPEIASTGVDFISVGALTHSVPALDLSMKVGGVSPGQQIAEMQARIRQIKARLGARLLILGHHYQRDDVLELADLRGDSLQLARDAAASTAETIVFCGVHFMAEVAATLAKPGQRILAPDPSAGCYLADTATLPAVQSAWDQLDAIVGAADRRYTPITYVNSSADLKAFCGRHGGLVCTSGNAKSILRQALAERPAVFFFPDQHLGRNSSVQLEIAPDEILLWDTSTPPADERVRRARVVLWPGACNVHQRFRPEHVHTVRARYPGIRVIVHPECPQSVASLADEAGSTAIIIQRIADAPAGTSWAVGTENRLVWRLQREHPEQTIVSLADVPPYCSTMGQVTVQSLYDVLSRLDEGKPIHEITVEPEAARWARIALERMLRV